MRDNLLVTSGKTLDSVTPIDAVVTDSHEQARQWLVDQVGADAGGEELAVVVEEPGVVSHQFGCELRGYPGWRWSVTVAQLPGAEATLDEIVLLPTDAAILAPSWVPWRERIKAGDLSPGDLLPPDEDDPRLVPSYLAGDDTADPSSERALAKEIGLGRQRVLSLEGRNLAADRWYAGDSGPSVPLAQSAPGRCGTCGFMVKLSGPLSTIFGVCANAYANDDARVVSFDHGCGAHSGAQLKRRQLPQPLPDPKHDTLSEDDLDEF
ncbi:MAG: DUF3027 domain-containing protein [Nocardioidaceae bacterium]